MGVALWVQLGGAMACVGQMRMLGTLLQLHWCNHCDGSAGLGVAC